MSNRAPSSAAHPSSEDNTTYSTEPPHVSSDEIIKKLKSLTVYGTVDKKRALFMDNLFPHRESILKLIRNFAPANIDNFTSALPETGLPKKPSTEKIAKMWLSLSTCLNGVLGVLDGIGGGRLTRGDNELLQTVVRPFASSLQLEIDKVTVELADKKCIMRGSRLSN